MVLFVLFTVAAEPLTLDAAIQRALAKNENSAVASERVIRARDQRVQSYAAMFPTVVATGSYTRRSIPVTRDVGGTTTVIQQVDALNGNIGIGVTVFDPSLIPALRMAERSYAAEALTASELRRALSFDVAQSFFAVLTADQLVEAARRRAQVAKETVRDASARFGAGLADRNEVTRSELEAATADLTLTQVTNGAKLARLSLGFLLVEDVEGPLQPPSDVQAASQPVDALIDRAASARNDLKARVLVQSMSEIFADEPYYRHLPRLTATVNLRATNEAGFSGRALDWNFVAALTWTLFDGSRYPEASGRKAEARQAKLAADLFRRQIGLEVRSALVSLETAEAAVSQADVRKRVALANAGEVRERFAHGLATALERADAAVSAFDAEVELARQALNRQLASLSLARALGQWAGREQK